MILLDKNTKHNNSSLHFGGTVLCISMTAVLKISKLQPIWWVRNNKFKNMNKVPLPNFNHQSLLQRIR